MASPTPHKSAPPVRSNLTVRLLTAGVVSPLILLDLFYGPSWSWYALVLLATVIGGWELFQMTHAGDTVAQAVGTALTVLVSVALWLGARDPRLPLVVILLLPIAAITLALARLGDVRTAAARMAATVLGPLWIGALTCTAMMRRDLGPSGVGYVVLTLMLAWFADTGGYFAGRFFGKHKLYEAVSPKKTWEGLAGALFGALVGALSAHFGFLRSLPLGDAIGLAIVVGALGQAGDLGESLLKRSMGVKDSGEIVPGHGGILDRLDALFITSALVYLYTRYV